MFDNIKRLKKLNSEVLEMEKAEADAEAEKNSSISVFLHNAGDALSPFCDVDSPIINSDMSDYLDNMAEQLPLDRDITIKINGEADKDTVKRAIKNYYNNRFVNAKREYRKNGILSVVFTVLAVLILTAAVIIEAFMESQPVLIEMIDIVGWVFIWEAADMFFLQRGVLRINQIRCLNFIRAKVE